jgi:predicted nucleic acid-binding protein
MAATVVLDTDVLSFLARSDATVGAAFTGWLDVGNGVVISRDGVRVSARRVRRVGRAARSAGRRAVPRELRRDRGRRTRVDLAAEIWAALARTGKTRRMDADILIAATALRSGYEIATRNKKDFDRLASVRPGLVVHEW